MAKPGGKPHLPAVPDSPPPTVCRMPLLPTPLCPPAQDAFLRPEEEGGPGLMVLYHRAMTHCVLGQWTVAAGSFPKGPPASFPLCPSAAGVLGKSGVVEHWAPSRHCYPLLPFISRKCHKPENSIGVSGSSLAPCQMCLHLHLRAGHGPCEQ